MATQQEVIKAFMKSLDTTNASGVTALNNAVKACSSFSSVQDVIDKLISDCKNAKSVDSFLKDKCGIILSNTDTGAITGSDAGGSKVKTAESIIPESGKATYPSGTSFTKRGLTVIIPSKDKLTADQQTVVQGLYSWWIDGALKLAEESYGYSFKDSDATVKKITLKFEDNSSSTLAYVTPTMSGSKAKSMTLTVNMNRFKNLSASDVNGAGSIGKFYMDRVLAHELTHAVMAAKIDNFFDLPDFILEGTAELTHGIDDLRSADIKKLAGDSSQLKSHLNVNGINATTNLDFSSGYIFLRYLAKQGASSSATNPTDTSKKINYVISSDNNAITAGGTYTIKKGFKDVISINTADAVTINGASAGTLSDVSIVTESTNADLTIKDLKVNSTLEDNFIRFGTGKNNKLTVLGTNTLVNTESKNRAGINVGGGLTIDGTGVLNVSLGYKKVFKDNEISGISVEKNEAIESVTFTITNPSAVIGTEFRNTTSPDITIKGGTINAVTNGFGNAIGGATLGNIGNIKITGGKVTAYSEGSTAIGAGDNAKAGDITITGNAVVVATASNAYGATGFGAAIGGSNGNDDTPSSVGNIIINGNAKVTASADGGAAIGSGIKNSSVKKITIGGNAKITAESNKGAGIGNGYISDFAPEIPAKNSVGNITITDKANVTVSAKQYGAAIGGGYLATYSNASGKSYGKSTVGNITISGNATVTATGEKNNVGIGSGYARGKCTSTVGTIKITDKAKVTINSNDTATKTKINGKNYSGSRLVFENGAYAGGNTDNLNIILGTNKNDTLVDDRVNVTINALAGDDSVKTYSIGDVKINAGDGNDYVNIADDDDNDHIIRHSNITVDGGKGSDVIYNYFSSNSSLFGGTGNDNIYNSGESRNTTLNGGDGNDYLANRYTILYTGGKKIYETAPEITFIGGAGDDTIVNEYGEKVTITGGKGNDYIRNMRKAERAAGAGNEVIYKYSAGDGNDTIEGYRSVNYIQISGSSYTTQESGNDLLIKVGKGSILLKDSKDTKLNIGSKPYSGISNTTDDLQKISLTADADDYYGINDGAAILALAGNDTIRNGYSYGSGEYQMIAHNVSIDGGTGNDLISNYKGLNVSISGADGNDTIQNDVYYGASKNGGDNAFLDGGNGNDEISNNNDKVIMIGGSGKDTLYNQGKYVTMDSGVGDDVVLNGSYFQHMSTTVDTGVHVSINAGAGNDSIENYGNDVSILGGAGNDTIQNSYTYGYNSAKNKYDKRISPNDVTIVGGTGDDVISLQSSDGNVVINYAKGDGKDTVYNFGATNTINISGSSYTTQKSGEDVLIKVGTGSILLKNAGDTKLKIKGTKEGTTSDGGSTSGGGSTSDKGKTSTTGGSTSSSGSTSTQKKPSSALTSLLAKILGKSSKALTVTIPNKPDTSIFSEASDLSQITNVFSDDVGSDKDVAINIGTDKDFSSATFNVSGSNYANSSVKLYKK